MSDVLPEDPAFEALIPAAAGMRRHLADVEMKSCTILALIAGTAEVVLISDLHRREVRYQHGQPFLMSASLRKQ